MLPDSNWLRCRKGFLREAIQPVETTTLSVLVGSAPYKASIMIDLLVVKAPSSYNSIISQPTLNNLNAITSIYYLKMKSSTSRGVGDIQREQVLS